jgi:hypothetical protein
MTIFGSPLWSVVALASSRGYDAQRKVPSMAATEISKEFNKSKMIILESKTAFLTASN